MICCLLALLVASPLGALLVSRPGRADQPSCCRPPAAMLLIWLAVATLVAIAVALTLALFDPPAFRHLCLYGATR